MTHLRLIVLVSLFALASCGAINSNVGIPAGEEFRLGENRHGAFSVTAENTGAVAVRVIEETPDGTRTPRAMLAPGADVDAHFEAGATAVFVNDAAEAAELKVKIVGDTNLTMGYTAAEPRPESG